MNNTMKQLNLVCTWKQSDLLFPKLFSLCLMTLEKKSDLNKHL